MWYSEGADVLIVYPYSIEKNGGGELLVASLFFVSFFGGTSFFGYIVLHHGENLGK